MSQLNVVTEPKTSTFQMRINPDIKHAVEEIYASSGLSLTDAINVFLQQTLNAGTIPFLITPETKDALRTQALERLKAEIIAGRESVKTRNDWISEDEMLAHFGIEA